MSNYCEDYPCCGHTPSDPCARQPYDEPGYYDTSRPGNEHALCDHENGDCDVDYFEDEGEECPECGDFGLDVQSGECAFCGYVMGDEPEYVAEDQFLDSYMEDFMSGGAFGD